MPANDRPDQIQRALTPSFFPISHIKRDTDFSSEDDEDTQATNINEMFDYALALLWPLVTKNKWDMTSLPDISEGFSYVSVCDHKRIEIDVRQNRNAI